MFPHFVCVVGTITVSGYLRINGLQNKKEQGIQTLGFCIPNEEILCQKNKIGGKEGETVSEESGVVLEEPLFIHWHGELQLHEELTSLPTSTQQQIDHLI